MRSVLIATVIAAAAFSFEANAFPGANAQAYDGLVILVGEGCGKGNHRNRQGQCVNGQAAEVPASAPGACPPGTRLGNRGRTCRRID